MKLVVTNAGDGNSPTTMPIGRMRSCSAPRCRLCRTVGSQSYATGKNAHSVVAVDVNSDGNSRSGGGQFRRQYRQRAVGQWQRNIRPAGKLCAGKEPKAVKAADVNGDGYVDLVTAESRMPPRSACF